MLSCFTERSEYRLLSLLLALLWGGLLLAGSVGMAFCQAAPSAPTAKSVCHCAMCRGMHRAGMKCCCCPVSRPPSQQATFCAYCDGSLPHSAAAPLWEPAAVLPAIALFLPSVSCADQMPFVRLTAVSLRRTPIPRPPRLQ